MAATFTPLYDWIAQQKDLSLLEKLVICKVLRYGNKGCYESYRSMARKFGVDHSNLTKAVKGLIAKDWLCVLYESKYRRILYVVPERLSAGPLFDLPGVNTPHPTAKSVVHTPHPVVHTPHSVVHTPHVVNNVSYNNERKMKQTIDSCAEIMRHEATPSRAEKENHKKQFLSQCKRMLDAKNMQSR